MRRWSSMMPLNRFGAAVVRSAGGEVAQVLLLPLAQGLAQAGDLADRAGREGGHDLLGDLLAVGGLGGGVGGANLLVALPGDEGLVVGVGAAQALCQPLPLACGEVTGGAVPDVTEPVERVSGAPGVPEGALLNAAVD